MKELRRSKGERKRENFELHNEVFRGINAKYRAKARAEMARKPYQMRTGAGYGKDGGGQND